VCETVPNGSMRPCRFQLRLARRIAAASEQQQGKGSETEPDPVDTMEQRPARRQRLVRGGMWRPPVMACAPKRRADRSAAGRREALARRSGSTGTLPRARALLPLLRLLCAARPPIPSASHSIMRRRLGPGLRHGRPAGPVGPCGSLPFSPTVCTTTPALRLREKKATRLAKYPPAACMLPDLTSFWLHAIDDAPISFGKPSTLAHKQW